MTRTVRSRIARRLTIACIVASVAACQDGAVLVPTAAPVAVFTVRSVVAVRSKDKPTIELAADILSKRIKALGVESFSLGIGDLMVFDMTVPATVDQTAIDAVLAAHGSIAFLSLPAGAADPAVGGPVPPGSQPIFDASTEITTATLGKNQNAEPVVDLVLGKDGTAAFADYTRTHIGGAFLLTLDGKVVSTVTIVKAIKGGQVELSFADTPALSREAITAIVASGPLPKEWKAD